MTPQITIYVRHGAECPHQGDENWKRCNCRKHLRWSWNGRQLRRSAKTRSWTGAEKSKRELELQYQTAISGKPIQDDRPVDIEQAIQAFINEKIGGQAAPDTLSKYRLTLNRLQDFCTAQGLYFVREITLEHLSGWRATWGNFYQSNFSLRNNQSRLRAFFRYCENAQWISFNPARALSAIKIRDEDYEANPFTEQQVTKIIGTVSNCEAMTPLNQERVQLLMKLQRWSGLSLVDATCLSRDELVHVGGKYRIDTRRRKTGTRVNVPIPAWLGRELSRYQGAGKCFFWTGASTPKSAAGLFDKLYPDGIPQGGHSRRYLPQVPASVRRRPVGSWRRHQSGEPLSRPQEPGHDRTVLRKMVC